MAKESRTSRRIPILNVYPISEETRETILGDERISNFLFVEAYSAIKEAHMNKKSVATIFSLNGKNTFYGIEKKDWLKALSKCLEYYSKKEEYEICNEIVSFKHMLNSKKNDKVTRSNKANC